MIQKRNSNNSIFFIQCGDWETVKKATSPRQACIEAVKEAKEEYKNNTTLSQVIIAMNLRNQMENQEETISAFTLRSLAYSNEY